MSKPDAERAMDIYRVFAKQTDQVVAYLGTARQYEHQTRVEVPKLKHAPVNLGKQLEDYLSDPDFEINRRQYIAEQEVKRGAKGSGGGISKVFDTSLKIDNVDRQNTGRGLPDPSISQAGGTKNVQQAKGPDPNLIDFFESIEQNQQPMATQAGQQIQPPNFAGAPQYQGQQVQQYPQGGFIPQQTGYGGPAQFQQQQQTSNNGYIPQNQAQAPQNQQIPQLYTSSGGTGYNGYASQPSFQQTPLSQVPQGTAVSFPNQGTPSFSPVNTNPPPTTNPFRMSMMISSQTPSQGYQTTSSQSISPIVAQSTNPFARQSPVQQQQSFAPPSNQAFQQPQQNLTPMRSASTGTNPFAKDQNTAAQQSAANGLLTAQPTGNTNPFRQSAFINTATGSGWQNNQQAIIGGQPTGSIETVPVFPRPAQQQPWQQ